MNDDDIPVAEEEMPVGAVQTFGYSPESATSEFCGGFNGTYPNPPPSGRRQRIELLIQSAFGQRVMRIGWVYFDANGLRESADLSEVAGAIEAGWLPDDPRVAAFLNRIPAKLPHMGAVQLQKENPIQFPMLSYLFVRPGAIEVVS